MNFAIVAGLTQHIVSRLGWLQRLNGPNLHVGHCLHHPVPSDHPGLHPGITLAQLTQLLVTFGQGHRQVLVEQLLGLGILGDVA